MKKSSSDLLFPQFPNRQEIHREIKKYNKNLDIKTIQEYAKSMGYPYRRKEDLVEDQQKRIKRLKENANPRNNLYSKSYWEITETLKKYENAKYPKNREKLAKQLLNEWEYLTDPNERFMIERSINQILREFPDLKFKK